MTPRPARTRTLSFVGDDAALVEALRGDHPGAVAAFYDRYAGHVHRVLARILGVDRELADAHHDVFVRALTSLKDLRAPSALRPWMTSVAVFTARTWIQGRARRSWLRFMPHEDLPETAAATASGEVTEALRSTYGVLRQMPPDERIAFALRFVDGMELTEVAGACGCSLATIKRRLARAEKRFIDAASEDPVLEGWLKGGDRWGSQTL